MKFGSRGSRPDADIAAVDNIIVFDNTTGQVGIGTTGPSDVLHIVGGVGAIRVQSNETDATTKTGRFRVGHYTNAEEPASVLLVNSTSTTNDIYFGGGSSVENAATSIRLYTAANNTTLTGTERVRIDSNGNVGIGTTSPDQASSTGLSISSSVNQTTSIRSAQLILGAGLGTGTRKFMSVGYDDTSGYGFLSSYDDVAGVKPLVLNRYGGNVGIGTTAPGDKLEVIGGNIRLADSSAYYLKKRANSVSTVIQTTRTDDTQPGLFRTNGWGDFSVSRSFGVGYDLTGTGTFGTQLFSRQLLLLCPLTLVKPR